MSGPGWGRARLTAALGLLWEQRLSGRHLPVPACTHPWDTWWLAVRSGVPATAASGEHECGRCAREAGTAAGCRPPRHPGERPRTCACHTMWARAMRAPGRRHTLIPAPQTVTVALLKPGAPRGRLREHLAEHYREVSVAEQVLSVQQCELLYPDAYGADFVAERTAYLTSGTVLVVVLRAAGDDAAVRGCELKSRLRRELGADRLRNHLHMPDNSAEVWADIAVLAGETAAVEVYGRWESDAQRADARVAAYRAALEFPG